MHSFTAVLIHLCISRDRRQAGNLEYVLNVLKDRGLLSQELNSTLNNLQSYLKKMLVNNKFDFVYEK